MIRLIIPLISSKKNNNYLEYENNKNEEQKNIKYNDIIIKNEKAFSNLFSTYILYFY